MSIRSKWTGAGAALVGLTLFALVAATVALSGASPATAQQDPDRVRYTFPVKYVCGSIEREGPFHQMAAKEPPVKPGNYATAINVQNLSDGEAQGTFQVSKAAVWPRADDRPSKPGAGEFSLRPGEAMEIDCPQVAETLGGEHQRAQFLKGFVTITSNVELEVVGVYTSENLVERRQCEPRLADLSTSSAWQVVDAPQPHWVDEPAVVVTSHPWSAALPGSDWISVTADGADDYLGGYNPNKTPEEFVYELQFELEPQCTDARLSADYKADDNAKIELNGHLVADYGNVNPSDPPNHASVTDSSLFLPGVNTLTVTVLDDAGIVSGLNMAGMVYTSDTGLTIGVGMSEDVEYIEPRVERGRASSGAEPRDRSSQ